MVIVSGSKHAAYLGLELEEESTVGNPPEKKNAKTKIMHSKNNLLAKLSSYTGILVNPSKAGDTTVRES